MTKRHVEAERSGPESGDFGPLLQCRSVSDPHVALSCCHRLLRCKNPQGCLLIARDLRMTTQEGLHRKREVRHFKTGPVHIEDSDSIRITVKT